MSKYYIYGKVQELALYKEQNELLKFGGIVLAHILRRNSVGQRNAKNFRLCCAPHPYATPAAAPTLQEFRSLHQAAAPLRQEF